MIKYFLIALFPMISFADSNELLMGSLTYHFFSNAGPKFANKLDDSGTWIANPMIGFRKLSFDDTDTYHSWTLFGGENSIGEGMGGVALSAGIGNKARRLGVIGGAYLQDNTKFYDRGIDMPFGMPVSEHLALAPVLGFELAFNFDITKRTYWTFYNLFTPAFYTNSIGIGWRI